MRLKTKEFDKGKIDFIITHGFVKRKITFENIEKVDFFDSEDELITEFKLIMQNPNIVENIKLKHKKYGIL